MNVVTFLFEQKDSYTNLFYKNKNESSLFDAEQIRVSDLKR